LTVALGVARLVARASLFALFVRSSRASMASRLSPVLRWRLSPEVTMSTTKVPAGFSDLMTQKKAFAHLATVMPDGAPQVTPVWFDMKGDRVRVNTARGRQKDRNMQKNAHVALSIIDPDNPYRHIAIRGRIAEIQEEGADAHIDSLAKKYLGVDKYPYARPGEQRVIYEIEPSVVHSQG
jgi:PPOX class probable F420-dependent enzyme